VCAKAVGCMMLCSLLYPGHRLTSEPSQIFAFFRNCLQDRCELEAVDDAGCGGRDRHGHLTALTFMRRRRQAAAVTLMDSLAPRIAGPFVLTGASSISRPLRGHCLRDLRDQLFHDDVPE
jgi:hypothetical protein